MGAALAASGADVWLLARSEAHVRAINEHGLQVRDGDGERVVRVPAATGADAVGPVDLVVVLVKSLDTLPAIEGARALLGPATMVMSLQNGLGHEAVLAEAVGRERVLAGKTYVGGVLLGPGRIIGGTQGKQTLIGELDGRVSARALAIAAIFERAGLQTAVSDRIVGVMWDKLMVNVATGALAAITRLSYGPLYEVPEVEAAALAAVAAAMAVARASGSEPMIDSVVGAQVRAMPVPMSSIAGR